MMLRWVVLLVLCNPAFADVESVVKQHILPGYAAFAQATATLDLTAQESCDPAALQPAYHEAFDAWVGVAHLRLGPSEGTHLSIAFWPDKRGAIPRTLSSLIAAEDPIVSGNYAEVSAAARGLFALEIMLYDEQFSDYEDVSYSCALIRAISADLAAQVRDLHTTWQNSYAQTLMTAGNEGNTVYLSQDEALQALYTQLVVGLNYIADQQLARPMGSYARPRPARAEAWRSGRSARNVELSLRALHAFAIALADGNVPETDKAFEIAIQEAGRSRHPGFQDVTDPSVRFGLESLQSRIHEIHIQADTEIGQVLGVAAGFNAMDGD